MTTRKTKDPLTDGLNAPGRELVSEIMKGYAALGLEPDERECALLRTAGECRDRLSEIGSIIDDEGAMIGGKMHPLLAEERQRQIALGRLLAGIAMTDTGGKNPAKVRAAQVRWNRAS